MDDRKTSFRLTLSMVMKWLAYPLMVLAGAGMAATAYVLGHVSLLRALGIGIGFSVYAIVVVRLMMKWLWALERKNHQHHEGISVMAKLPRVGIPALGYLALVGGLMAARQAGAVFAGRACGWLSSPCVDHLYIAAGFAVFLLLVDLASMAIRKTRAKCKNGNQQHHPCHVGMVEP